MKTLQILGTGCARCQKLAENAQAAAEALGLEYQVEKITNLERIASFGVMMTPALAVDGEVKSAGRLLDVDSVKRLLS